MHGSLHKALLLSELQILLQKPDNGYGLASWKALLPYRQRHRRTVAHAGDCARQSRSKTDVDVVNPAIPAQCNRILGSQSSSLSSTPCQDGATTTEPCNPLNGVFPESQGLYARRWRIVQSFAHKRLVTPLRKVVWQGIMLMSESIGVSSVILLSVDCIVVHLY